MKQNKTNRRWKFYYEFINSKLLLKSIDKFLKKHKWSYNFTKYKIIILIKLKLWI